MLIKLHNMEQELFKRITELENRLKLLENTTTIPLEIDRAFRDRLGIDEKTTLGASTKNISTETQAVNEGGAGSYSVPKMFDGFYQTEAGTHIPYYDA
jgi:hypothetical protein